MIIKSTKIIIAGLLIFLLLSLTKPHEIVSALSEVSLAGFCLLMLLSFVMIAVSAAKWHFFIDSLGQRVNFFKLYQFYLLGYFINIFLPSYIGGDALRSYYVGRAVGQNQAFSATILERVTGLLAMLLLAILAVCLQSDLIDSETARIVVIFASVVLIAFFVFFLLGKKHSSALLYRLAELSFIRKINFLNKIFSLAARFFETLFSLKINLKGLTVICFLSLFFHCLTVVNTYYAAVLVGWSNPPVRDLFIVLPIILIIAAMPITPAGLGVQEGVFFHYLQQLGASPAQALAVALLLRAKTIFLAFCGWLVWLNLKKKVELKNKI